MTAHPNAHILAQLAEIARTDLKPWNRLEVQDEHGNWVKCGCHVTLLNPSVTFRIKPTTVNIGGVVLERPLREAPEKDTRLWLLFDNTRTPDVPIAFFRQLPDHNRWLNERRLFASKEARDKYQDALVKLANGESK